MSGDEARKEAETRWPPLLYTGSYDPLLIDSSCRVAFVAGAEWQASRKVEHVDREALRGEFEYRIRTAMAYGRAYASGRDPEGVERASVVQREIDNAMSSRAVTALTPPVTESEES